MTRPDQVPPNPSGDARASGWGDAGRPAPWQLRTAAAVTGLEALVLIVLGVLEVSQFDPGRATMNLTTTIFFLGAAAALGWCALGLWRGRSWGRSPVVLAQLIVLGLAWNFRDLPQVALPLLFAALLVLGGIFAPASLAALEPENDED